MNAATQPVASVIAQLTQPGAPFELTQVLSLIHI